MVLLATTACRGQHYSDAPLARAGAPEAAAHSTATGTDTVAIDRKASEIAWKGTKMWGRGMHTGVVPVKQGFLLFRDGRLAGGALVVDMTAIGITDIPPDQPEPIRILTGHLEDEVFFDVANYPEAQFVLTGVEYLTDSTLALSGNLRVKGVANHIAVPAAVDSAGRTFTSRFRINRFKWNIAYRGGFGASYFAARNFVDKYIELRLRIIAGKRSGTK